jgi:hypothetical protein
VSIEKDDNVLGIVANPPPVVTPIIEDAYKTRVLIDCDVMELAVILLADTACVEIKGGITLVVNNDATVDASCSVFTEFPPVMLDTERNFVSTFWVDN